MLNEIGVGPRYNDSLLLCLIHCCLDSFECHGQLKHRGTDGIVYGCCNHPAHTDDGGLPASLGREARVF